MHDAADSCGKLAEIGLHVGRKNAEDMLFYAVALHGAAKRFSALTKFSAADFGYRLARLAGGRVVNDAEVRAAFGEKRRQTLKNVVDHR